MLVPTSGSQFPSQIARAYAELEIPIGTVPSEELMIRCEEQTRVHIRGARAHTFALGSLLYIVRNQELFRHHPQGFTHFADWLRQPEISLSESRATDLINLWQYVLPAARAADVEPARLLEVDESKVRDLVSPIRKAAEKGKPLPKEEIQDLIQNAETLTSRDFRRSVRPTSTHQPPSDNPAYDGHLQLEPPEEEEIQIFFQTTTLEVGNRWRLRGDFNRAEMEFIARHTRCTFVDPRTGEILRLPKPGQDGEEEEEE